MYRILELTRSSLTLVCRLLVTTLILLSITSPLQSKEKMKRGSRRACIQLKGAIIGIDDEDDCTFTIRDQTRTYHFQGEYRGEGGRGG